VFGVRSRHDKLHSLMAGLEGGGGVRMRDENAVVANGMDVCGTLSNDGCGGGGTCRPEWKT